MPNYAYICETCDSRFEEFRPSISLPHPPHCPSCQEPYGQKFTLDWGTCELTTYCHNITTLGQQAELNSKRMGKEQVQMKEEAAKPPVELPWWRSGEVEGCPKMEKPLDLKKVKDVRRYVETGETT